MGILIAASLLASRPAISETPGNLDFQNAITLFANGDFESSAVILNKLVKANRDSGLYWFNLANVFYSMKKYKRAIRAYETVIKLGEQEKTTLAPMAMLYLAKTFRQSGQNESAIQILKKLISLQSPLPNIRSAAEQELKLVKSADDVFKDRVEEGVALYKSKRYEEALEVFKEVMGFQPSAEVAMMVALSYLQMSEPQKASFVLGRVLKLHPTPELKATALELIVQIGKNLWPRKKWWWVSVDTAYGYNSNVLENGFSERLSPSASLRGILDVGYHLVKKKPWTMDLGYQYSIWNYDELPGEQRQLHGISIPVDFQNRAWLFQLVPYAQWEILGDSSSQSILGASGKIHKPMDSFGVGIAWNYLQASAARTSLSYLTGDLGSIKSYFEYLNGRVDAIVYYSYLSEEFGDYPYNSGTFPQRAKSHGVGVDVSWLISPQWEFQWKASYWDKNFDGLAMPGAKKRKDNQTYTEARISFNATSLLTFYLNQEAVFNNSTLTAGDVADWNFRKFVTYFGLKWNIIR